MLEGLQRVPPTSILSVVQVCGLWCRRIGPCPDTPIPHSPGNLLMWRPGLLDTEDGVLPQEEGFSLPTPSNSVHWHSGKCVYVCIYIYIHLV